MGNQMTPILDFYDVSLMHSSLETTSKFMCGTEYEIEDVKTIKLPGANILYRDQISLTESIPYWIGNIGLVQDNSLRNGGVEFITKPMDFDEAIKTFNVLHDGLTLGPEPYTSRTSIHVHINMANLTMEHLKHFLLTYALLEPVFFEVAGETRKHNIHCVPLCFTIMPSHYSKSPSDLVKLWSKYSALNLMPVKSQGTVEFRHLYGTGDVHLYTKWLTLIKELWQFIYDNPVDTLEKLLKTGQSPEAIQKLVLPSSLYLSPDFSDSLIDVKLAF